MALLFSRFQFIIPKTMTTTTKTEAERRSWENEYSSRVRQVRDEAGERKVVQNQTKEDFNSLHSERFPFNSQFRVFTRGNNRIFSFFVFPDTQSRFYRVNVATGREERT